MPNHFDNFTLRTAIITCPARSAILSKTLQSYATADFTYPAQVFTDSQKLSDKTVSQTQNAFRALTYMLGLVDWNWLLFAEDDVEFNQHIEHNLRYWPERVTGDVQCGKLYSCAHYDGVHSGLVPADDVIKLGGSQGILLSRAFVLRVVQKWAQCESGIMQDLRLFRLADRVHVHQPNLVQHRQAISTWGGLPHVSDTFDLHWRR